MNSKNKKNTFYDGLTVVTSIPDIPLDVPAQKEGSALYVHGSILPVKKITCGAEFGKGKEADIFRTNAVSSGGRPLLAKIYKKTTDRIKAKNRLMLSKAPHIEEICWPEGWLSDSQDNSGRCLGILIPQAPEGAQKLGEFIAGRLSADKRLEAARLLVENFKALYECHVQPADFNLNNFLVSEKSGSLKIYFIDTDSYQVENFPCPVAAPDRIFDHPLRIQQGFCDYASELRKPYELAYGACVLLFKVLVSINPYIMERTEPWLDSNDPENILSGNFRFKKDRGPDAYTTELWKSCPERLRRLFKSVFAAEGLLFYKEKR